MVTFVNDSNGLPMETQAKEKIRSSGPAMVKVIAEWMHNRSSSVRSQSEQLWKVLDSQDIPSIKALVPTESMTDRSRALEKLCEFGQAAMPARLSC